MSLRSSLASVLVVLVPTIALANPLANFTEESASRLPANPNPPDTDTLDVDLIDVDGDGDLDLFVAEGTAGPAPRANLLFINDGTGNFTDETFARLPGGVANSTEVDAADADGDGDLDLIVANLGPNQLLLNDGTGHFSDASATHLPPPPFNFLLDISAEARFVDIEGDGDPDIFVSNENPFDPFGGGPNLLLVNDGTGHFTDESAARLSAGPLDQTSGVAVGDIDTDGDVDLVVINIGANAVLLNDGTGHFTDETAVLLPGDPARSSRKGVLGDVSGDGCLDLVVGNSRAQANELHLGDCDGFFADASSMLPADTDTTTDIDLVDLDGDGDLDIYVTNAGDFLFGHGFLGQRNRVLRNDVSKFKDKTDQSFPLVEGPSTNAELGDVDGDGDLDLVVANSTSTNGEELLWIAQ